MLNVTIDPLSGFCFGVVYAIEMAEDILDEYGELYCLGDIVHNDMEVRRLEAKGLRIINHTELRQLHHARVLIRAHGEPPSTYHIALENNLELIDASCPVVLKLQNRIRNSYEDREHILIYGKKDHAEVIGLQGNINNEGTVFANFDELDLAALPERITLYSQTTKNKHTFYDITRKLQAAGKTVNAHDTICRQVSNRDEELRSFAHKHDVIVFVAGKKSSNGHVLYGVCREENPRTYFISSPEELNPEWFSPTDNVGICGATSTPQWLMEDVRTTILRQTMLVSSVA